MTHKELVEIGYKWLLKNGGVGVAFKELKSTAQEIPDVIGFDSWKSIVIECKASRSDFLQDKKKTHRSRGMGTFRFYCCPKDMIKENELPEKWGLLYVAENGKCRVVKDVRREQNEEWEYSEETHDRDTYHTDRYKNAFDNDPRQEQKLMYAVIRRLFARGLIKHIYEDEVQSWNVNDIIDLNNTTINPQSIKK